MKKSFILCLCFCFLIADNKSKKASDPKIDYVEALFTGPLLAPSANTVPAGHIDFEPYLFANYNTGVYNHHWEFNKATGLERNIEFEPLIQIGLTSFMDLDITPIWKYNVTKGHSQEGFGDLGIKFGFQLLRQGPSPIALKLSVQELLPTGKYQNLDPKRGGVDSFGSGSYVTTIGLASSRKFSLEEGRDFRLRFAMSYSIPSNVNVHGLNSYGGDKTTNGYVTNAGLIDVVCGLEYSLTRQWALALDIDSLYQCATHFKGSTVAKVGKDTGSYVFSLAPAIEYNFNTMFGLIGGVWFSVFGYEHTAFINGVIALNVYV